MMNEKYVNHKKELESKIAEIEETKREIKKAESKNLNKKLEIQTGQLQYMIHVYRIRQNIAELETKVRGQRAELKTWAKEKRQLNKSAYRLSLAVAKVCLSQARK